jgi:general stress protein 26
MDNKIKQKIIDYLASHRKMALATLSPEGKPVVHTVEYASEGATVYFTTDKKTRKVQNILKNPTVAYSVDEDYDDWMKIQGVQMEARATVVSEKADIDKALGVYIKKFPFIASFPPNPDLVFIKVEPIEGFFLDYTKGFAHKDKVTF